MARFQLMAIYLTSSSIGGAAMNAVTSIHDMPRSDEARNPISPAGLYGGEPQTFSKHAPQVPTTPPLNAVLTAVDVDAGSPKLKVLTCSFQTHIPNAQMFIFVPQTVTPASRMVADRVYSVPSELPPKISMQMYRWVLFRDFVKNNTFAHVLICDAFDVAFQADPFATPSPQLVAVAESSAYSIASEPTHGNMIWVQEMYSKSELDKVGNEYVLNAGFTMGGYEVVKRYLDSMSQECTERLYPRIPELQRKYKSGIFRGMDQGIHNWVIYNRFGLNASEIEISHTLALIGNGAEIGKHFFIEASKVQLLKNTPSSVFAGLHQYNRVHELNDMMNCKGKAVPLYCARCRPW
jgi:hypothetical protein